MKKQSVGDQLERLLDGRCPVHGHPMPQIGNWHTDPDGKRYTIVKCPRQGCNIKAKAYGIDGPWELL